MSGRFVTLRNELLASILTEWLPLKFVALVDSAMCTNNDREIWLKMLKGWYILPDVSLEIENRVGLARWLISRSVRVNTLKILSVEVTDANVITALTPWLPISANALRSVSFLNDCFAYIPHIYEHCTQLRTIEMRGLPSIAFWNIVRNNKQLNTLLLKGSLKLFVAVPPTKLAISELTVPVDVYFLKYILPQLPDLQRLSMFGWYSMPLALEPCNRLISLNLREAVLAENTLVSLVGSLKIGLRRLVLPLRYYQTNVLLAIWPLHASTLECLELYYQMYWCIAELVNPCVVLHTLVLRSEKRTARKCALTLLRIRNSTIRTLHLDTCDQNTIRAVNFNFDGILTLGIKHADRDVVIDLCGRIIVECRSIRTIYSKFCMPAELRSNKQSVVFKEYTAPDLFSFEYKCDRMV